MQAELKVHPDTPSGAISRIEVRLSLRDDQIDVTFVAHGEIRMLRIPQAVASGRADELWKHTCFELFLRAEAGDNYMEFNFSPSTQWAAYSFTNYREGMASLNIAPQVSIAAAAASLELSATFELGVLNEMLSGRLRGGASAVIEEVGGEKSYWALAHPPGKPDFHHLACFALHWE